MATLLLSFKKADGGLILHGFIAKDEKVAEKMKAGHAEVCPQYGPAVKEGNTIENVIEIEDIPTFDAEDIDEWVNDMFGLDEDEEEEDDAEICAECGKPADECEC